jgi:hypothetical protein
VARSATVTATFSERLDASSVTASSVELRDAGGAAVPASVAYVGATQSVVLTPSALLNSSATYTARVRGGAAGVRDRAGNALAADVTWSFTTASAADVCPCTLFPATATPGTASADDPNAIEIGVKFRTEVNGYITAIRFYKGALNTGVHTVNLWTAAGSLLASTVSTSESSSGWQQVALPAPIAVSAGTIYVASYHTSSGRYSGDGGYFYSAVVRGPLTAPSSGESGGNGVYQYGGSSAFPANSYNAGNYWVDVVFTSTP